MVLGSLLIGACGRTSGEAEARAVAEAFAHAWRAKDAQAIVDLHTEDAVFCEPPLSNVYSGEEIAGPYREFFTYGQFEVDEMVIVSADSDAVAVRFALSGRRSFVTGLPWKMIGIIELEIRDGRISKQTWHYDPRPLVEDRPFDHVPIEC